MGDRDRAEQWRRGLKTRKRTLGLYPAQALLRSWDRTTAILRPFAAALFRGPCFFCSHASPALLPPPIASPLRAAIAGAFFIIDALVRLSVSDAPYGPDVVQERMSSTI